MIHRQLLEDGHRIGKERVLKYIGLLDIQAIYPTKKRITSLKNSETQNLSIPSQRVLDRYRQDQTGAC